MSTPDDPEKRADASAAGETGIPPQGGDDARPAGGTRPGAPANEPAYDPGATVQLTPEEIAQLGEETYPSDPDDPLVGTLLRNKWRVLGRIGSGSFGTVYKVRDVNGQWIEALKILSVDRMRGPDADAMRQRFLREAQIMKRLGQRSPYIVGLSTYEDDIEAGLIYFLMEHVEGRILSEVLLEEGPLRMDRVIRIGLQVCDALIAAHESEPPVVHRDLKLENLMLTQDRDGEESIKVLDFGIAKIAEREGDSRLTAQGTLGTPGYAAPEQLRAGNIDGRTDLFAFGVILYCLVTGKNPWLGHLAYQPTNQTYELMAASDRAEVIPIVETGVAVPQGMIDIIMRLLQREPENRYQSARELRDALFELGGGTVAAGATAQMTRELAGRSSTPSEPERRLAAVWFADLVGYSTLSSQDEEAALTLLDTFHKTARRVIEAGGGRVVQFIGDAVFAEFSSTQRAVVTARDFQVAFTEDTSDSPFTPLLRIGVHVGDVLMAADGDVFGDGVNIAARIQGEAEPGQILVSQDVWRQLKQRRDFGFVAIGERSLKGIGAPVSLFAVVEAGDVTTTGELAMRRDPTTGLPTYEVGLTTAKTSKAPRLAAAVVVTLIAIGGVGYGVMYLGRPDPASGPDGNATTDVGSSTTPLPADQAQDPAAVASGDGAAPGGAGGRGGAARPADPVEDDPPPEPTPAQVDNGGGAPATGTNPPVTSAPDPLAGEFRTRSNAVSATRMQATSGVHEALRDALGRAEALWTRAEQRAGAGDYRAALTDLGAAEAAFGDVIRDSGTLRDIDAARDDLEGLRARARNRDMIDQVSRLEGDADRAVAEGRYGDALGVLDRAAVMLTAAASVPETTQPPEPEPVAIVPSTVAEEVMDRLEAAMEARDLAAAQRVWTSMSDEEASGFRRTFGQFNSLGFNYVLQSTELSGSRVLATVSIAYEFPGVSDPVQAPTQRFEMEDRGSGWVIVASSVEG